MSGLQGGILKLVDTINKYTDNTEQLFSKQMKTVIDKLTAQNKKAHRVQGRCTDDHTVIAKLLENFRHKM